MDKKLIGVLANVFRLRESEVQPNLKKEDIGNWDSLRQMDLVTSLEREFEVILELEDIIRINSFQDIDEILTEKGVPLEN